MTDAPEIPGVLSDPEAERAVLGAAIVDPRLLANLEALRVDHFDGERNRLIYTAMVGLIEASRPVDLVTLVGSLRAAGRLEDAGGAAYVARLTDGVPRGQNLDTWTNTLREKYRRRKSIAIASLFLEQATTSPNVTTDELLDHFSGQLGRLMEGGERKTVSMRDVMAEAVADLERYATAAGGVVGAPTGLAELDSVLGGLVPGRLYVVAARTNRGKSVFCLQAALSAAAAGHRALVFSMEMPPYQWAQRGLQASAVVDRYSLRSDSPDYEYAWSKIAAAVGKLSPLPIDFDRRESPTIAEIRTTARQVHSRTPLGLVVVDFLQRCTVDRKLQRDEGNWLGVGDIAKGLKSLAMSLNVPVLAACQLTADAEDKRPTLANLAQAQGIISSESDAIILLHPDDLARWKTQRFPVVNFLLDKNRHGPCLHLSFSFEKEFSRFVAVPSGPGA